MPESAATKESKKDEEVAKILMDCKITNALLLLGIKQKEGDCEERILDRIHDLAEIVQSADSTFRPLLRDPRYYLIQFDDNGIRSQLRVQAEHEWILNPTWEAESPIYKITETGKKKLEEWAKELPLILRLANP